MPTVSFTAPFLSQTTEPDRGNWTDLTGYIRVFLVSSAWITTRTATMRGVYTFPSTVTINSVSNPLEGALLFSGTPNPSVSVYFNEVAYGPYTAPGIDIDIGPVTSSNMTYVLTENILTVDVTVRAQRLSAFGPGMLYIRNPEITVDYSERPAFCNLGINF